MPFGFLATPLHGTIGYLSSGWPVAYLVGNGDLRVGMLIGSVVHVSEPAQVARQSSVPSGSVAEPKTESCRADHRHGRLQVGWRRF